ncbi:MAG TPA: efflux RND transporter periplasmic adaptor subunit, partial [Rhizomicrobium sp.]|nr:efflux RND transporter periplasmic adaptor subunit [Rhizomicrobium sp.]
MRNEPLKLVALAALCLLAACGKSETPAANTGSNVTLTAEQRRNIKLYTVAEGNFRRNVDSTGVVDFDNDQATAMMAPFSGTVSRIFVQPGAKVKKGDALAAVVSPDYAGAVSTYRKALVTA